MLRLRTFGPPILERDGEQLHGAARQRRVIALLTILAVARDRGISRDRVLLLLWPESDPDRARQALTQSLYHARKAVGEDGLFITGADLALDPRVITTDVAEFEEAIARGDRGRVAQLYSAPFLDGFFVNAAPEFERWAAERRNEFTQRYTDSVEQLAREAEAAGDCGQAVEWWKRLAAIEPLNSRLALDLMRALASAGDRAGAIRHAHVHEELLRQELGAVPNLAIVSFAEQLREVSFWTPAIREPSPLIAQPGTTDSADASRSVGLLSSGHPSAEEVSGLHDLRADRVGAADGWPASEVRQDPVSRPGVAAGTDSSPLSTASRSRGTIFAAAVSIAIVAASYFAIRGRSPSDASVSSDMIVVAPFRVAGADPALSYLREGLVDLLVTKLTEDDAAHAADPGAVMNAWRQAGFADRPDVPQGEAVALAHRLGGERLLVGSVVGAPNRIVISASLLGVPDGGLRAQATAEGPADSLTATVDRLVASLIAKEAGQWEQLANHTSASALALRAYLDGQAAYRRGGYRDAVDRFRRALEIDRSFAMAGLGLAQSAERLGLGAERSRGLGIAWEFREQLSERDSVYLVALAGPGYPGSSSPRDLLAEWERASSAVSDRAEVWHALGERLFYDGRLLGAPRWEARASAAFERAVTLDAAFVSPLQYLVQLDAMRGDTVAVRRDAKAYFVLDSIGDLSAFVRWRAAIALRDVPALQGVRRRLTLAPSASLRTLLLSSQYSGIGSADAEQALKVLESRAVHGSERIDLLLARHALLLNRGELGSALKIIDELEGVEPLSSIPLQLTVLDHLYGLGDSAAAGVAVTQLVRRSLQIARGRERTRTPPSGDDSDACVLGQWHAWRGDSAIAADAASYLLSDERRSSSSGASALCGALVQAVLAVRQQVPSASASAARVDSLLGATTSGSAEGAYMPLALARVYEELGEPRRALAAVRRRPQMQGWPHYQASHLREEGRLAVITGDTAGARRAYRDYLALRVSPISAARVETQAVRAALDRLTIP
ncbi:MAG: BTAD domain-containing putative transcriptional regulator [Gemmatimonadaceae bacterium]